jgi:hypothetical protein
MEDLSYLFVAGVLVALIALLANGCARLETRSTTR